MKKFFSFFLVFSFLLPLAPTTALASDGPLVSAPEPRQATVNIPVTFWLTASDSDGISECRFLISSKDRGAMTYNSSLNRYEFTWTFNEMRTANSIRGRCTDTLGNTTNGPAWIIPVLEIDRSLDPGTPEDVNLNSETDATGFTMEELIAVSPVLIKTQCPGGEDVNHPCRTVYFLDTEGKRHAFPNEPTFFTWYDAFTDVHIITTDVMGMFPLGPNVRYRPGSHLVKFPTLHTVYAVGAHGELRPIASEAAAIAIYGADWSQQVDDISDVFYGNYHVGAAIESSDDPFFDLDYSMIASINDNL